MVGYGDIFGGVGSLIGTGFQIAGAIQSSKQAKQQAQYFAQMQGVLNNKYNQQRGIQVRTNYLEQGQYQQNTINAGIDTSAGASASFQVGKQNLIQVQGEQLQQMDYEHQLQMMGISQQIKNANQMASNYMIQGIGMGVAGGLKGAGSIMSGYSDIQNANTALSAAKTSGLNQAMQMQRGTGF